MIEWADLTQPLLCTKSAQHLHDIRRNVNACDDGAGLSTPEGSDRKAYTARAFSQPSADFVKRLQDRPDTVGSRQYTRVLALAGGLPIKVGDEIVGAVGVSGTPGKDDVCSQAGIDKVAASCRSKCDTAPTC